MAIFAVFNHICVKYYVMCIKHNFAIVESFIEGGVRYGFKNANCNALP